MEALSVASKDQLKVNLVIPEDAQQSRVAVAFSDRLIQQIPQALATLFDRNLNGSLYDGDLNCKMMLHRWTIIPSFCKKLCTKSNY